MNDLFLEFGLVDKRREGPPGDMRKRQGISGMSHKGKWGFSPKGIYFVGEI